MSSLLAVLTDVKIAYVRTLASGENYELIFCLVAFYNFTSISNID